MRRVWKQCNRCLLTKPKRSSFTCNQDRYDGVSDICRECQQEMRANGERRKRMSRRPKQSKYNENCPMRALESSWFGNLPERQHATQKEHWPVYLRYSQWDEEEKEITKWRGPNHRNNSNHAR